MVGYIPNCAEAIEAMAAVASIGKCQGVPRGEEKPPPHASDFAGLSSNYKSVHTAKILAKKCHLFRLISSQNITRPKL